MPKTTLGVHVSPRRVVAVRLKSALRGASVDRVFSDDLAHEPDSLEAALRSFAPFSKDTVVASLGADALFHRVVELPFTDLSRIERAAPLEGEESLPLPLERLTVKTLLLSRGKGRARALIIATPNDRLGSRVDSFRAAALPLAHLDAEPVALHTLALFCLDEPRNLVILHLDGEQSQAACLDVEGKLCRFTGFSAVAGTSDFYTEVGRSLALWNEQGISPSRVFLCGPDALDADLGAVTDVLGLETKELPYPQKALGAPPRGAPPWPSWALAAALALREAVSRRGMEKFDFLKQPRSSSAQVSLKRQLVALGIFAAVLLGLWAAGLALEAGQKNRRLEALKTSIRDLYRSTFPTAKSAVDEVEQTRQALALLEERAKSLGTLGDAALSPVNALREISARIPSDLRVEFREFVAEEERIRIDGETTSFDAIDKIKARLAQTPGFAAVVVSDAKAGVDAGKVIFKVTIQLGRAEKTPAAATEGDAP